MTTYTIWVNYMRGRVWSSRNQDDPRLERDDWIYGVATGDDGRAAMIAEARRSLTAR